ncbi:hypothetical protein POM88_029964 [Heracleum sosnowskyi]|uniref:Plus3 domain-containing protein n=1 Tax=Heracleum sosnowskyi TaxID=360622 RepID=A0AAD8MHN1_9APIA|nr:hypothetical protein POM88_029964 [Heracleum sosnowskyi]
MHELRLVSHKCLPYLFRDKYVVHIRINELVVPQLEFEDSNNSREKEEEEVEENENETTTSRKRKIVEAAEKCFASIVPENIRLVYLKRSSVEELLVDVETFESKLVGIYMRIECVPDDYVEENSHVYAYASYRWSRASWLVRLLILIIKKKSYRCCLVIIDGRKDSKNNL